VDKAESIEFIQSDPLLLERGQDPDIYIDFLPDPVSGYLRELEGALGGDPSLSPPGQGCSIRWSPSFAHRGPYSAWIRREAWACSEYQRSAG
jgi:hypothetical protein